MDAEPFLDEAKMILQSIAEAGKDTVDISNIQVNLGKMTVFHDVWGDGLFTDWMVQRKIQKNLKCITQAIREVQKALGKNL